MKQNPRKCPQKPLERPIYPNFVFPTIPSLPRNLADLLPKKARPACDLAIFCPFFGSRNPFSKTSQKWLGIKGNVRRPQNEAIKMSYLT